MIHSPSWLVGPYILNILLLVPVCFGLFFGGGVATVFEGKVTESEGLRLMMGSLWFAILLASIAGLVWPAFFAPILIMQVIYKAHWLLAFVLPKWISRKAVPFGVAGSFAFIVATYPLVIWMSMKAPG